jgi:NitT/TauT family transport system permease protein
MIGRIPVPVLQLAVIAALLAVWEIAARTLVDPMFLSPPSTSVMAIGRLLADPMIRAALALLLWELAAAFVISVALGLACGLAVGLSPVSNRAVMPVILLMYATPQIAILPVIMLAAGIGPASKVIFGVTHGFFPVVITVAASVRNLRPVLMTSAIAMGAGPWHRFRYVTLPHIVPGFFAGMRLAMTAVLLGVLLAELYASSNGIGHFTRQFTEGFAPANLMGLVALVAALAILLNTALRHIERRFTSWRQI